MLPLSHVGAVLAWNVYPRNANDVFGYLPAAWRPYSTRFFVLPGCSRSPTLASRCSNAARTSRAWHSVAQCTTASSAYADSRLCRAGLLGCWSAPWMGPSGRHNPAMIEYLGQSEVFRQRPSQRTCTGLSSTDQRHLGGRYQVPDALRAFRASR